MNGGESMSDPNDNAIREARRKYYREWRAKNPDKQKAIMERFWRKKLDQAKQERAQVSEPESGTNN